EVPDEDVQTAYEIRLRELSGPETRVLAQLSGADRSAVQEAADQIVAGATPEDAANTVDGVDLTVLRVQESELADDAFASAAFRAPEGDVLIPVPSGSGWATALIREVVPGDAPAFEDVEELLRQDLAQRDAERIFETNLESLYDFVGGGFEISEIATEMGVPLLRFAPIDVRATTQSGAFVGGVARFPDAMQTAFDALEGELSDIIEDDNDGVYVLSLDEVIPQNAPPLETIREDVLATYKTIRRAEALEEIASGISTAATSLETLQSNAAAAGLEAIVLEAPVERRAPPPNVDNQILAQAFALAEQSAGVTPTADGGSAVVWVDAIMRDDASDAPALLDVGKRILADSIRSDLEIAFRQAAVEVSDLQINSGEIETYVQSMAGEE
ncbi:MAG: peptidyl-prolyl cis-trans isomerase, partial [Pseudomonadota bacterium]